MAEPASRMEGDQLWRSELPSLTAEPFFVYLESGIKLSFSKLLGHDETCLFCVGDDNRKQLIRLSAISTVAPAVKPARQS